MDKVIKHGMEVGYAAALADMKGLPKVSLTPQYKGKKFHVFNNAVMAGYKACKAGEVLEFS